MADNSLPPLPARLEKLRDEAARAHNPWPQSGGMFDGEQMEKSFSAGFTAAAYLYQEEMARLEVALDNLLNNIPGDTATLKQSLVWECMEDARAALTAHARFLSGEDVE